jgi:hypothetical protein
MRTWIVTAAVLAAFAAPAAAQDCAGQIKEVSARLEQAGGLDEEAREAVLAALDAARLADAEGDMSLCATQVEAARQTLEDAAAR